MGWGFFVLLVGFFVCFWWFFSPLTLSRILRLWFHFCSCIQIKEEYGVGVLCAFGGLWLFWWDFLCIFGGFFSPLIE